MYEWDEFEWNELSDQEQIDLWWEYNAANIDYPISFSAFSAMMQGFAFW